LMCEFCKKFRELCKNCHFDRLELYDVIIILPIINKMTRKTLFFHPINRKASQIKISPTYFFSTPHSPFLKINYDKYNESAG